MRPEKIKPYSHDVNTCLSKIIKRVKKFDPNVEAIEFDTSSISMVGVKPERYKTGQPVTVYHKKGKNRKTFVAHIYCPFCGKKF